MVWGIGFRALRVWGIGFRAQSFFQGFSEFFSVFQGFWQCFSGCFRVFNLQFSPRPFHSLVLVKGGSYFSILKAK